MMKIKNPYSKSRANPAFFVPSGAEGILFIQIAGGRMPYIPLASSHGE